MCREQRKGRMTCAWDTHKWTLAVQLEAPRGPAIQWPLDLRSAECQSRRRNSTEGQCGVPVGSDRVTGVQT